MLDKEFDEWLGCLSEAEKWLRAAFDLMDGIEGYTSAGEAVHGAALSALRAVRTAETAYRNRV